MLKPSHNIYTIKTSPYNDSVKLENLLNEMSKDGWELYSMQEIENDDGVFYNCIFVQETENEDYMLDKGGLFDFRQRIERIINSDFDPYEQCLDLLKKIKDKRTKISQIKILIDDTPEDSRAELNEQISKNIDELGGLKKQLIKVINPDAMEYMLRGERLSVSVSEELASLLDSGSEDNLLSKIVLVRRNFTEKSGYIIPKIKLDIDDTLEENEFCIKVRGIPAVSSSAYCGFTMFENEDLKIEKFPADSIKIISKITDREAVWINNDNAENYWLKGLSAAEYIASLIEYTVIKYIDDIFDCSDINRYIEIAASRNLYLVENIIPEFLSVSELKYILTSLVKENVSIKDIAFIFEKINDFTYLENTESLLAHLRASLSRQICSALSDKNNTLQVYELSDEFLEGFDETSAGKNSETIKIDKNHIEKIIKKIKKTISTVQSEDKQFILTAPMDLRHDIFLVLSRFIPNISVIAPEEIHPDYTAVVLGKI